MGLSVHQFRSPFPRIQRFRSSSLTFASHSCVLRKWRGWRVGDKPQLYIQTWERTILILEKLYILQGWAHWHQYARVKSSPLGWKAHLTITPEGLPSIGACTTSWRGERASSNKSMFRFFFPGKLSLQSWADNIWNSFGCFELKQTIWRKTTRPGHIECQTSGRSSSLDSPWGDGSRWFSHRIRSLTRSLFKKLMNNQFLNFPKRSSGFSMFFLKIWKKKHCFGSSVPAAPAFKSSRHTHDLVHHHFVKSKNTWNQLTSYLYNKHVYLCLPVNEALCLTNY